MFGPVAYASAETRLAYVNEILRLAGLEPAENGPAHAWLWRRIPHPEKPTSTGGPEVDVGFQTPDVVVLGEAKWRSGVGRGQGVNQDRTQVDLRRSFCEKFGSQFYEGVSRFVVLGLSLDGSILESADHSCDGITVSLREIRWDQVAQISSHPVPNEVSRYFQWKLSAPDFRSTAGHGNEARTS